MELTYATAIVGLKALFATNVVIHVVASIIICGNFQHAMWNNFLTL
jgi:hypothetical protein